VKSVVKNSAVSRTLHILTGPTAVGKTEHALAWAEANNAEIVSCDSLLFYRGMDLGTAKPSPAERARVPHHLIDVRAVTEPVDVTYYVTNARCAAEDIAARGRAVLVVGGSGFYLKSFFAPVADEVRVPPELRTEIAAKLAADGLPALVAELGALNPAGLGALDTANPRRVTRALERCRASGRTLAELAAEFARLPAPFVGWNVRCTRLDREPAELDARITVRVDAMLRGPSDGLTAGGLVDEVRRLRAAGLEQNPSAAGAIGYRETLAMLDGRLPEPELAAEIAKNTRALVKKQRTWFRTQLPPHRALDAATAEVGDLFPPVVR
jgi:tRNA dimethylallyltransferase